MHKVADIEVAKNIMDANAKLAHKNLHLLEDNDIFCVDFVGAIGSGKTSLIEDIIDSVDEKVGVIAGDVISKFDAGRIESHNVPVVGLNTGKECHLDAHLVSHGLGDLPLEDIDYLFIENVGNLICPVDFELGSHMRIVVVSVTEGDDTVEKHPLIFQNSDLVIINKIDLADAVGASVDKMVADAKKLNPDVKIITSSLKEGKGLDEVIGAIEACRAHEAEHHHHHHDEHDHHHDDEHGHHHHH
jgi:hydrogenase nickel incorporation protein HypB